MGTISVLLVLCEGKPSVTGGFPHKSLVIQSFNVLYKLSKLLKINCPVSVAWDTMILLWRHYNETHVILTVGNILWADAYICGLVYMSLNTLKRDAFSFLSGPFCVPGLRCCGIPQSMQLLQAVFERVLWNQKHNSQVCVPWKCYESIKSVSWFTIWNRC